MAKSAAYMYGAYSLQLNCCCSWYLKRNMEAYVCVRASDRQQYKEREREKTRVYKTVENLRKKKQRTELRI